MDSPIPTIGQYWKLIGEDDLIPAGDLVLVVGFEDGEDEEED